jgi:hypothetical protein
MADGRTYNLPVCQDLRAGLLRQGTYLWPVVRAKHHANVAFVLDDLPGWEAAMLTELGAKKFTGAWIRVHDAGDFFSDDYLNAWLRICCTHPDLHFYAYTKEVDRFRRLVEPDPPDNLLWVYSYGGTQDQQLDPTSTRSPTSSPTSRPSPTPGSPPQDASDLLALLGPRLVGIPANRIRTLLKAMAGRRFSDWQAEDNELRVIRRRRRGHDDDRHGSSAA